METHEIEEGQKFNKKRFTQYLCDQMKKIKADKDKANPVFDQFYRDWRDIKLPKNYPWVGCANWSVPVTSSLTDVIIPKIVEGIFDKNPIVDVKARNSTGNNYRDKVKQFIIDWDIAGNEELLKEIWMFIQNTCIYGTGFVKTIFEQERGVRTIEYDTYVINGQIVRNEEGEPLKVTEEQSMEYAQQGIQFDTIPTKEKEEYWKKYRPSTTTQDIKRIYWSLDADSIEDAYETGIVATMFFSTKDKLKRRLKDDPKKLYKNLDKVKIKAIESSHSGNDEDSRRKKEFAYKTKKMPFYEMLVNYDIDDDGLEEKVVAIVHLESETLLGYEEFQYDHEECPIVAGHIKPVDNNVLGIGIPEMLYDSKAQIDSEHNARTDRNALNNNKPLMYEDNSGFNVDTHKFGPGRRWPVKDMKKISFLDTPNNEINSEKEENLNFQYAQRRSGQFDNQMGKSDPRNKTATGILALLQEGNIPIRHFIRWISLAIAQVVNQRWALYNQFWGNANDEEINRWIDEILDSPTNPLGKEDRDAFKHEMNIYFTASKESKERELQKAQSTYDIVQTNPLFQQFPYALREMTVELLRQIGYADADKKVPTQEQILQYQAEVQKEALKKLQEEQGIIPPEGMDDLSQAGTEPQPEGELAI